MKNAEDRLKLFVCKIRERKDFYCYSTPGLTTIQFVIYVPHKTLENSVK